MPTPAPIHQVPSWFVVLPDHAAATPVAADLLARQVQVLSHASGRPALVSHPRGGDDAFVTARAGATVLAVAGQHTVSPAELARIAEKARTVADVEESTAAWPGSFHLVASVDGQLWVRGPYVPYRRTFHTTFDDVTLAADRADVLARLTGASLDESRLAVALLGPLAPHPIGDDPVWHGVSSVPAGTALLIGRDGIARTRPCWTPPATDVPLARGAHDLRTALIDAVAARTNGRDLVSADLGGLDSTSLCCVAARGPAQVVAYTWAGRDPLTDDEFWARRTATALPRLEHHVVPPSRMPFTVDHQELSEPLDEPCGLVLDRRWLTIAELAASRGSRVHLSGFGGDELLGGSPAHLHGMLRRTPRNALRDLHGYAAQDRWPYAAALRQLLDPRPYRAWLAGFAAALTGAAVPADSPMLGWGRPITLPSWAAPAAEAIRAQIPAAAEPLAPSHGQHQELSSLRSIGRTFRHLHQMAARRGITLAVPFYDDHVIRAALSVRPEERVTPWRYKPLVEVAMRGIVPPETLARQTKPDGSHEIELGIRANRPAMLTLCENSRLARLGLVDEAALRQTCERPLPADLEFTALLPTLACELWLRSLEGTVPTLEERVETA